MKLAGRAQAALRFSAWVVAASVAVVLAVVLFWLKDALYNRFVRYPGQQAAWAALRAERQHVVEQTGWAEYRGVLHSHSHLSHDSQVSFEEILRALHQAQRDFICLSDHCVDGRADFDVQWRGLHDGKLFIPGFEMKDGIMPFGVRTGVVLSNRMDPQLLAEKVVEHGGLLFYAHSEEPRVWERLQLTGMEIYNIHADLKDEGGLLPLLPDLLLNQRRYPEQVLRSIFDAPVANLRRWDELNQQRHLTGIAGNDCHQNTGVRVFYTNDTVRVEDTSPKLMAELKLNRVTRWLARVCLGPLTPGRDLFRLQLDPYERMVHFVSTHVLARELTEASVLESLKAGRAFVAFDMLADSTGFVWQGMNGSNRVVMGESLAWSSNAHLHVASPQRCRFTVLKDGVAAHQAEGFTVGWAPPGPGVYRVEAELKVGKEWTPWIYANPIWIR
jgi:hypothetical protein